MKKSITYPTDNQSSKRDYAFNNNNNTSDLISSTANMLTTNIINDHIENTSEPDLTAIVSPSKNGIKS